MDEYVKNIDNLDETLVSHQSMRQSVSGGTPVVPASSTPPQITGSNVVSEQSQVCDDESNYLKQQKVVVRKYRLKK